MAKLISLRDELLELQQHAFAVEGIAEDEIAADVHPQRRACRTLLLGSRHPRVLRGHLEGDAAPALESGFRFSVVRSVRL
jgi:hypothetical protein